MTERVAARPVLSGKPESTGHAALEAGMVSNAERMIEAIRVISDGTLYPLARPRLHPSPEMVAVYEMAQRAEPNGLNLLAFERAGISSEVVAEAVRRDILGVELPDDSSPKSGT